MDEIIGLIEQAKKAAAALDLEFHPTLITLYLVAGVKWLADGVNFNYIFDPAHYPWMKPTFAARAQDFFWGVSAVLMASGVAWVTTEVVGWVDTLGAGLIYGAVSVGLYLALDRFGWAERLMLKAKPAPPVV